jgi:hypothetical protein
MPPLKLPLVVALLIALFMPLCGCETVPAVRETRAWHGETPIYATYRFGRLNAELPPGHSIETVNAVARTMLHRQGHVIEEYAVTPSDGRIVALANASSSYDKIKITTRYEGGGVLVQINVDPSTENRTRAVFESIVQTLGI